MSGKVENLLKNRRKKGPVVFVLIDSEASNIKSTVKLAKDAEKLGATSILVGGSSATDQMEMAEVVGSLKKAVKIPIILFPGNITGVVPQANVLKFGLEALPTAYLVIGEGTSAWFVGNVRGIPFDKPKIAAAYSLSAQFLGMRFVYLEAGSGAKQNITPEMVKTVRSVFKGFLIVGGGIKDAKTAKTLVKAGADGLVIGTLLEQTGGLKKFTEIIKSIRK